MIVVVVLFGQNRVLVTRSRLSAWRRCVLGRGRGSNLLANERQVLSFILLRISQNDNAFVPAGRDIIPRAVPGGAINRFGSFVRLAIALQQLTTQQ